MVFGIRGWEGGGVILLIVWGWVGMRGLGFGMGCERWRRWIENIALTTLK